jgi:LmbE family N-acetylglucosaminyl deacetylase
VAVGAHPDDIELGCAGSLAYLISQGARVINVVMTNGEKSGDPEMRRQEAIKAAEVVGVEKVYFAELNDTLIHQDSAKGINFLEGICEEYKPELIFTHSPKDIHQDHRETYSFSIVGFRRVPSILIYEIPGTPSAFTPDHFFNVTELMDLKKSALDCHDSQLKKYFMDYQSVMDLAAYRGRQCKIKFAEAFETLRYLNL